MILTLNRKSHALSPEVPSNLGGANLTNLAKLFCSAVVMITLARIGGVDCR